MTSGFEAIGPRPGDSPGPGVDADRDRWKFRRRMIFGAAILLGALLLILAFRGQEAMFANAIWAFVALVTGYIGLPIADDFLQSLPTAPRAA